MRLEKTAQMKEKAEEEKVQARVARAKAKARKSQEESSGKEISRAKASGKQKAQVSKKVSIIISDDEGEKAGGLSDLQDPDWYHIDNFVPSQHSMGLRSRDRKGRAGGVTGVGGEESGGED
ncbi:hypothetical protein K440DRAFT_667912 [Wilcoxina mikolae CBS 423.85]|nr:hypothetical protein K440DRAFT_667912 [Wilcoxina mikolae CBS 423.85]